VDGSTFLYLGKAYPLTLVEHQRPALVFDRHFYLDRSNLPRAQAVFTAWYREQARGVLEQRVAWCARQYGLAAKGVRITSARTRWGSCSSRGTLNFTWRLVMAPLEIIDYVVIHELAHLKEKNHSPAFWQLVERMLPDFRWRRDWLKKNGHILAL
jgi:predicted metal-dependent hydrolase